MFMLNNNNVEFNVRFGVQSRHWGRGRVAWQSDRVAWRHQGRGHVPVNCHGDVAICATMLKGSRNNCHSLLGGRVSERDCLLEPTA